jgi:hypothetical protein
MVHFQTKNPNLGKFWGSLEWKMLVYFMVIWNILWQFGIFYGHLEHFNAIWNILWPFGNVVVIWYIFPRFGVLSDDKSGNPGRNKKMINIKAALTRVRFDDAIWSSRQEPILYTPSGVNPMYDFWSQSYVRLLEPILRS